jgi:hypothetical protein
MLLEAGGRGYDPALINAKSSGQPIVFQFGSAAEESRTRMYPHFFGLDLTAALPWFLMGFLLSACILGLWNFLSGSRSMPSVSAKVVAPDTRLTGQLAELQEHLAEMQADLELARTSAMQIANEKVRIETDLKKSVLPLAHIDQGHADQLAQLQADLATAKASAVQYANEKVGLEAELKKSALLQMPPAQPDVGQHVLSLMYAPAGASGVDVNPASAGLSDLEIRRRNEIADLNAELWALRRSDVALSEQEKASSAEIARLKAQLSAPSPADLEVKRLTADVAKLKSKVDAQTTELSNKSGFIAIRDAELDRLEALLANSNTATKVVALNGALAKPASAPASATEAAKHEAESARLRVEVTRLSNEVASKSSLIAMRDAELDRLESLVVKGQNGSKTHAALPTAGSAVSIMDATQYTSEITRLRALVDQTRSELSDKASRLAARETELGKLQGQTGQAATYIAEHNHLRAEIARLSQQNAALSLDIANYQRVREALQEANRIAAKS